MKHIFFRLMSFFVCLVILSSMLFFGTANATSDVDQRFKQTYNPMILSDVPILHEGRIKPLESFAVLYLKAFKDTLYVDNKDAMSWLINALLDPTSASIDPIFYINHRDTRGYLGLPTSRDDAAYQKYVSLTTLIHALEPHRKIIDQLSRAQTKTHTHVQAELVRLQSHVRDFNDLLQSFSFALPVATQGDQAIVTYLDVRQLRPMLLENVAAIIQEKSDDIARYTQTEQATARLAYQMQIIEQSAKASHLFKIIPVKNKDYITDDIKADIDLYDDYLWQTPWATVNLSQDKQSLAQWSALVNAYYTQDADKFNATAQNIRSEIFTNTDVATKKTRLQAELFYNSYRPLLSAMVLYGFVLLMMIGGFYYQHRHSAVSPLSNKKSVINNIVFFGTALAIFSHGLGIVLRMVIMQRPPVTSLYETMLFVSFIIVLMGFLLFFKRREIAVLGVSVMAGLMILVFSATFLVGQDSMHMLVAVLNTNFWLTTHVIIITAGYGFCLLAAMVAHLYLVRPLIPSMRGLSPQNFQEIKQDRLSFLIYLFSLIALLLTAVGTILGGVWADQSWGRFWGWDPKENGALLIVLWLIWLLHGRLSGHLSHFWFVMETACLNIIVAIAWFGVNLLNVGLHSYGFISGIADGLFIFCMTQIFILIVLGVLHKRNIGKLPK